MRVLRLYHPGDVRLGDEPQPAPAAGEELVRVTAVGLCGSDLQWLVGGGIGDAKLAAPLVLGHEFAGVVETGELRGRRVAVDPAIPCGRCESCIEGNPNLCMTQRFAGSGMQDGAFQEFVAWPTENLFPLPDSLTDSDGAILEPLGVAIHAVDLGHLKPGMTVGVFGCGPIGLLLVQLLRASAATTVIATEVLPHRLDAARAMGATAVFQADDGREVAQIMQYTDGRGVDVAFEVAGKNNAVEAAMAAAKPGGRVVLIGIPSEDRTYFTAAVARRKGLTFMMARRMKLVYPRAIRLVQSGLVDVRSVVTHHFPLTDFDQALEVAQRREGLKVMIEP